MLYDAPEHIQKVIRGAILCNRMGDPKYELAHNAGAFLQGDDQSGWIFVEFWKADYEPFVDLLNKLIAEEEGRNR